MRGFTLIELLVCISIIGLLIALLFPALAQVRLTARSTICRSQLSDSAVSLHAYINDFGTFPVAEQGMNASTGELNYYNKMHAYFGEVPPPSMDQKVKPWVCPLDGERAPHTGSSYRYVPGAFMQHSQTNLPADPNLARSITQQYEQNPMWAMGTDFDWWHVIDHAEGGRRNEVCYDGHVYAHKIVAWYDGFISLDPWE